MSRNNFIKIIIGVLCLWFISVVNAQSFPETFQADTDLVQQYKEKIGRWVMVQDKIKLAAYISEFGSSEREVFLLNTGLSRINNIYVFVPFGERYLKALISNGITRITFSLPSEVFLWPTVDVRQISSSFGFRQQGFHTGIDIPSPQGSVVRAAMDGQVSFTGYGSGYGNMIDILHRDNFMTRYGHNSVIVVKQGDFVKKGQAIALVGSSGNSTGCHVHFEIRCYDIPLDPLDFLPDSSKIPIVAPLQNWKQNDIRRR